MNAPTRVNGSKASQRGISLLMSLMFLMVLALLGTWAATSNSLQERMAGGTRNRDLALEAAEAALKHAESTISSWRAGPFDGTVAGLLSYNATTANDMTYWRDAGRWTNVRSVPTGNLAQVASMPAYVIQKLPNTANPANPTLFDVENFRVTARAVGGDASAVVILQSIISYTP